jgi:hypothetical protein
VQGEQDLTRLAPKGGLIATQPVEGTGRQIGQANKGACEVIGMIRRLCANCSARIESAHGLVQIGSEVLFSYDCVLVIDDLRTLLMSLPTLAEVKQVFRLDLEQAALDRSGTT